MATQGMALAFRITGGLSAGFTAATGRASGQLRQMKGQAAELSAELSREQAALRGAARDTQEYADRLQRIDHLKGRLRGLSGEIQAVGAHTRRQTQAMTAARAGMVRTVAVSGALVAALGATAFATGRAAREYLDLRLAAASAGVEASVLAADIRRGTAVLGGNADAARGAANAALTYQKNLALMSVGLGQVDNHLAAVAGINPWAQVGLSLDEVRGQNIAAIDAAKGLGDELERTRRLAAIEQLIGPEQFRSLYQYTELTAAQRAEVDELARRQRRAAEDGAAGWAGVSHRMGLLRGETGLLSQTFGSVFSPALESVTGRMAGGVKQLNAWVSGHDDAARAVGYAGVAVGGLATAVLGGTAVMAGYRAALWSVTGATRTGAAVDALRTGLIWRMTSAVAANTLAAGRQAAAWIAGRTVMVASTVATGAATAAQWLLNGALSANTLAAGRQAAAWIAGRTVMVASTVATGAATAAQWLLNGALYANPIGIVIAAVAGLIGGLTLLYHRSERFRNIIQSAWALLKKFWPVLLGPIGVAAKGFELLYNRVEFIRVALDKVFGAAKKVGGVLKGVAGFLGFGGDDDESQRPPGGPPPGGQPQAAPPDYGLAAAATGQPQAAPPDYGLAAAATGQPQAAPPDYGLAAAGVPAPPPGAQARVAEIQNTFYISGVSVEEVAERVIELLDQSIEALT